MGDFSDIFTLLKGLGAGGSLGAVFGYLWWRSEGKREKEANEATDRYDKLQERVNQMVEKSNDSRTALAVALENLARSKNG